MGIVGDYHWDPGCAALRTGGIYGPFNRQLPSALLDPLNACPHRGRANCAHFDTRPPTLGTQPSAAGRPSFHYPSQGSVLQSSYSCPDFVPVSLCRLRKSQMTAPLLHGFLPPSEAGVNGLIQLRRAVEA